MATIAITTDETMQGDLAMPLEQYLRTVFHPDREYVNGIAEERPVGEWDHGMLQFRLAALLMAKEPEWEIKVVGEVRLQIRPGRFRIPDIMVLRADGEKVDRYPTTAPLLCIEILSPEDRWRRLQSVVDDYCEMGVNSIWALDPETRMAYYCDRDGFHKTHELAVKGTQIRLRVTELFALLG